MMEYKLKLKNKLIDNNQWLDINDICKTSNGWEYIVEKHLFKHNEWWIRLKSINFYREEIHWSKMINYKKYENN